MMKPSSWDDILMYALGGIPLGLAVAVSIVYFKDHVSVPDQMRIAASGLERAAKHLDGKVL